MHLQLNCTSGTKRPDLLSVVAEAVGGAEFVQTCIKVDAGLLCDENSLVDDPLLEAAYEELDEYDQLECGDIRK